MRKKPWGEDTHSQSAASPPPLSSSTTLMDEWRPCVQSSWGLLMTEVCLPQEQDHRGLRNLGATRKYPHSSATVLRPIRTCAESSMATDPIHDGTQNALGRWLSKELRCGECRTRALNARPCVDVAALQSGVSLQGAVTRFAWFRPSSLC